MNLNIYIGSDAPSVGLSLVLYLVILSLSFGVFDASLCSLVSEA